MGLFILKEYAEQNHVSPEAVMALLYHHYGVRIFNAAIPISREEIQEKVRLAVAELKQGPRPIRESTQEDTQKIIPNPKPQPNMRKTIPSPRPQDTQTWGLYSYQALIRYDYILFTATALWKPNVLEIMKDIARARMKDKTRSKIILLGDALQQLATSDEDGTDELASVVGVMVKTGFAQLLKGSVTRERQILGDFINGCQLTDTILLLCGSGGLHRIVKQRNDKNRDVPGYMRVQERDVDLKGRVTTYKNHTPAFPPADGKARAPYAEVYKKLFVPDEGGTIFVGAGRRPVTLGKKLGFGTEASVYTIERGARCVKLFNQDGVSEMKEKKVLLMCSKYSQMLLEDRMILERVAWPEEPVYNSDGSFIGFAMRAFNDVTAYSHYNYRDFPILIPGVKKMHQINMAISFVEIVDFLHRHNVILCDINKENLMFDSQQRAFLIDLDSAQIADDSFYYPTSVYFPEFLPPERIGLEDHSYRKEKADDMWIVQMLLFSMLTPCGNPYATTADVKGDFEAIKKGMYPYQSGSQGAQDIIGGKGGPWHIIVGHFLPNMKSAFWESFHHDGRFFARETRRNTGFWLSNLTVYQRNLPRLEKTDPNRGAFMPDKPPIYVPRNDRPSTAAARRSTGDSTETFLKQLLTFGEGPGKIRGNTISWDSIC